MAKTTKTTKVKESKYTASGKKVKSLKVYRQPGSDHGLYAQWTFPESKKASSYRCDWEYAASKNAKGKYVWLPGTTATPSAADAGVGGGLFRNLWTAPAAAIAARCKVTPVSKSRSVTVSTTYTYKDGNLTSTKKNKASRPYFKAKTVTSGAHNFLTDAIEEVELTCTLGNDGVTWTVVVECADEDANFCDIQMAYSNFTAVAARNNLAMGSAGSCSSTFAAAPGADCWFRGRCQTTSDEKTASAWATVHAGRTKPAAPGAPTAQATGANSARIAWPAAAGAATYEVEYVAGSSGYFSSNPAAVQSQSGITGTVFTPTNLTPTDTWWFRVRGVNEAGAGAWSTPCSCVTATVPAAPTVFANEGSYMAGDDVYMRWQHNSEDGSSQSAAEVEIYHDGTLVATATGLGSATGYTYGTSDVEDGVEVTWRARTKGAHPSWSPWSELNAFTVYTQPQLLASLRQGTPGGAAVDAETPLSSYPLVALLDASGGGNSVVGYDVRIVAGEPVDYIDGWGLPRSLAEGEPVWAGHIATSFDPCAVTFGPGALLLEEGYTYRLEASVAMASGLSAAAEPWAFTAEFDVGMPDPDALVEFDPDYLTASIKPACHVLDPETGEYTDELRAGTELSVYRVDTAGVVTLLESGIPNDGSRTVVDLHPPFYECWYHIVARDTETGTCSFADEGDDSPHDGCTFQWGEGETVPEDGSYPGTTLDGFVNVSFTESASVEKSLVHYEGRERKVSWYGSDLGESASYVLQFPASDHDKLALCRELKALRDDVYIRESTGTGFWASVDRCQISYDEKTAFFSASVDATPVSRADGVELDDGDVADVTVSEAGDA